MKIGFGLVILSLLLGGCRSERDDRALAEERGQPQRASSDQGVVQQADPNAVSRQGLDQGTDPGAQNVPGAANPGGLAGGSRDVAPSPPGTRLDQGPDHGPNAVDAGASGVVPPPPNQPGARPNERDATQLQGEIPRHGSAPQGPGTVK